MKHILLSFVFFFLFFNLSAQLIAVVPENPDTDSDVTITFDAVLGNGELAGYTGDVYAYTGVITTESQGDWDWKHVRNGWGEINPNCLMTALGDNLYEISFNIRDFYEIGSEEQVLKLAFLFHNADYSLVGRTADGGDIFVEINKQSPGDYVSHQLNGEQLEIQSENGLFQLQFYNEMLVKTEYIHQGSTAVDTSFTVSAVPQMLNPSLAETDESLSFSVSGLEVYITKSPLLFHYIIAGDTILSEADGFEPALEGGSVNFSIDTDEQFYGGGSRAVPVNRRGMNLRIYNEAHYGYGNNTQTLNISIPMVASNKGYALFFDNRFPADMDLGATETDKLEYRTEGGRLRYYFIAGSDLGTVSNHYTWLTGRQKMPPLWALGYIQSKYGYQTESEARAVVQDILEADFPLDALILDLYWFGGTADMGNLDWDYGSWPTPEDMMSDFSDMGVKTILITEPYFTLNSVNYDALAANNYLAWDDLGDPFVLWGFWAGDASLLDITQAEAQDWMWNFYDARRSEGVAGWWCDLGEPETHPYEMNHALGSAKSVHNIYSLIWARFIDEKYSELYPEERLFNLIRSGYAGMQRYSAFPWSGDIQRSFDGLRAQIPIMLGAGMSGLGYMHSDVGGFTGNDNDSELMTRWVQFGVFAPVFRMHGTGTTEPINFPEPYKSIMREYINLRYRLLPYNYTLAYENASNGYPLARQLNYFSPWEIPDGIDDSYFWGKNFFVAPVLERDASERAVAFPPGQWLNYHTQEEYNGGESYTVSVDINDIPVYVRAACFIPTVRAMQNTDEYSSDSLVVQYFPDKSLLSAYDILYDDNGSSPNALPMAENTIISFSGNGSGDMHEIEINALGNGYTGEPDMRNMLFEIYRTEEAPADVMYNGESTWAAQTYQELTDNAPAWYFSHEESLLYVNIDWDSAPAVITIDGFSVGISEEQPEQLAGMYLHPVSPNPVNSCLNVRADVSRGGEYRFEIYSVSGELLETFRYNALEKQRIVLEHHIPAEWPAGMYLLRMRSDSESQTRKFLLE